MILIVFSSEQILFVLFAPFVISTSFYFRWSITKLVDRSKTTSCLLRTICYVLFSRKKMLMSKAPVVILAVLRLLEEYAFIDALYLKNCTFISATQI